MKNLVRKHILKVTPYKAGKPIEETKRELGLQEVIKLASNENALGASPKALAAIRKTVTTVNRYPDSQAFYLKKKLADKLSLVPENIVLGNGSDELIDVIIKTFVEDDEEVLTADVTFLEYEILSRVNNRRVVTVPLKAFRFDLQEMKKKITARTKLVFIANPNNPTGTYVSKKELVGFVKDLPAHVLVVLDEAYDTFIDVPDFPRGTDLFKNNNLMVMRTFSKAYGLAGLRIGYAVGSPALISYMECVRQPFNVNLLAQAAAMAALDDDEFLRKTRKMVLDGKRYLSGALRRMRIFFVPSVANFILVDTGRNGVEVFQAMLKEGVIVRDMQQYGLNRYIRVTIGTPAENKKFVKALKNVLNKK
ncbi:MAG: histidinol-phosphate transaminase [Candidatus Omnitrophota bacterium]|jgi:histidinol-phosphate aminotransferase